jgi:release factor glutamine methyltransferase
MLKWAQDLLKNSCPDDSGASAKVLMSSVLEIETNKLAAALDKALTKKQIDKFKYYVFRRARHEPTHYILGQCEFMGLNFKVNRNVLIPRPETEFLVYNVLEQAKTKTDLSVLDLCCGGGAIALSLLFFGAFKNITASDISKKALEIAKQNYKILCPNKNNIEFILSDMFSKIGNRRFDIIVSNPPYISKREKCALAGELFFEPRIALFAKDGGQFFYRKIAMNAKKYLNQNGQIFLELNSNLSQQTQEIFYANGFSNLKVIKDYGGLNRILWIKL